MVYHNSASPFANMPPVVKNLLIINIIGFVASFVFQQRGIDLNNLLGLHMPGGSDFAPYQFVTYMFMHGSLAHIFFNMFALVSFGSIIERYFGSQRFFIFYFVCGIGAAFLYLATTYWELLPELRSIDAVMQGTAANAQRLLAMRDHVLNMPVAVGASGAVYGLLAAFGLLFPNATVGAFLIIPMRARTAVLFFAAIELYLGVTGTQSGIAHFAHIGGMLFGYLLIKWWRIPPAM